MVSEACKERGREIIDRAREGGLVVEVGALHGHLSSWVMPRRPDLEWIMVDNWLPREHQPGAYIATRDDHALHDKRQSDLNRRRSYESAIITGASILHMSSARAASLIEDGTVDLVFIDGDHSYEGCSADLLAWWPKVTDEGWFGGHDYHNPDARFSGVDMAVNEAVAEWRGHGLAATVEKGRNYTWWVRD